MLTRSKVAQYAAAALSMTFVAVATSAIESSGKWFLMSRHGDCAEIATIKRKIPELPNIEDPVAFSEYMRANGHAVSEQPLIAPDGGAHQIDVPVLSLNLIFVQEALCEHYSTHD